MLPHLAEQEHAVTHALSLSRVRAVPTGSMVEVRMAFVTVVARLDGRPVGRAELVKSVVAVPDPLAAPAGPAPAVRRRVDSRPPDPGPGSVEGS